MSDSPQASTEQSSSAPSTRPTNFGAVVSRAFNMFKKNFWMVVAFTAIPLVLETGSNVYVREASTTAGVARNFLIISLVVTVLLYIAGFLGYGGAVKYVADSQNNKNTSFGETLGYVFGRIGEGIMLVIRIFIYSYAWILLIIFLLIMAPSIINLLGLNEVDSLYLSSSGMTGGLAIIFTVVFILLIKRLLSVTFAFPILLADPSSNSKSALEKSVKISKGKLTTIFVNYLLLGLAYAVIGGIYGYVAAYLLISFGAGSGMLAVNSVNTFGFYLDLLTIPLFLVLQGYSAIFQYAFTLSADEEGDWKPKKEQS